MILFFVVSSFVIAIISVFLGFLVFYQDKKNPLNIVFAGYIGAIFLWSFFYGIWLLQKEPVSALFWSRALNFGATLIPTVFLHWVLIFLKKNKEKKNVIILKISYFLTFLFVLISFSDLYIKSVEQVAIFQYWPQANYFYILYLITGYFGIGLYGLNMLYQEMKNSVGIYREQIRYALIGTIIGFLGGATNYPLMMGFDFLPIGQPFIISLHTLFAYAIIKHRLMDIRLALRKYSVYLFSLFSVAIIALTFQKIIIKILGKDSWVIEFLILSLSLLIYPYIKKYYYKFSNKYLFSSLYDSNEVISLLSKELGKTLEIQKIYDLINDVLENAFHFQSFAILKYDRKKKKYVLQYNKNFKFDKEKIFLDDHILHDEFIGLNKVIVTEELIKHHKYKDIKKTVKSLRKNNIEIITPLKIQNKVIGLVVLSKKESGDMYNEEDLQVLDIISTQSAMAIENASLYKETVKVNRKLKKEVTKVNKLAVENDGLYKETLNFNQKLTEEVEKATFELRVANIKLKRLDQAKSEFISIASHQLRTPLTVIKGYISMMLEGNFGFLNTEKTEALSKVYDSNERLIKLVENLLNVSRIESGRLQFSFMEMQLEKLVESVVDELKGNAKEKKIKLIFDKSKEKLPKLLIDEEKLRQVIMNLIDNAIKYTDKGSVTVMVKKIDAYNVEFSVADSGMGISPKDMKNLFKKFSRGTGTSLVHTEGTGLGLYVAKKMIISHRGKIWAESKGDGLGSRFCFTLPIQK